jgi:2-oxoacid:acceptor oxidoreductase delta subunit (pyruvate/2-ketoisovalerate family)
MKLKSDQVAPWGRDLIVVQTGGWRSERPVLDLKRCQRCGQCWLICPTRSIHIEEGPEFNIDLTFCKGCGLCARECRFKAIGMIWEQKE